MAAKTDTTSVQSRAEAKYVRLSARKARLVLDHIRGRSVPEARTILAFTSRAAAEDIGKVLGSAVANAESAHALDGDELVVIAAYANEGPTLKRWRARARGRVNRIRKRSCHITVVVGPAPHGPSQKRGRRAAESKQATVPGSDTISSAKPKASRSTKKKEVAA